MDTLVKKAYENLDQVVEYDGKSLVNGYQNNRSIASENELRAESIDYGSGLDHQLQLPTILVSAPSEQQMNSGIPVGGKHSCFLEPSPWILSFSVPCISFSSCLGLPDSFTFVSQNMIF